MNEKLTSLYCIKCGSELPIGDYFYGCPHCFEKGEPASVAPRYQGNFTIRIERKGMAKYADRMPYEQFCTLGEGNTPVVSLDRLAQDLGLNRLYSKNEFQNPTGSHKDRMTPFIVERAIEINRWAVAIASSGNAGVSLASYASAAGIDCFVVSAKTITDIWKASIIASGGNLVITDTPAERLEIIKQKIDSDGWYPASNIIEPPVGSCCYGLQGYKAISYELYEEFGDEIPEFILVPTTRGDLLWGIYAGLKDLKEAGYISHLPRLVAVEPLARLERVLAGDDYRTRYTGVSSLTSSIGGATVTFQSKQALEDTNGFAVSFAQEDVMKDVLEVGRNGLYLETSSAAMLSSLKKLISNKQIPAKANVLLISTSHGFKNNPSFYRPKEDDI